MTKDIAARNHFSFKQVSPGHLFLGCIRQVREFELLIALPNRLHGIVPCNAISAVATKMFTEYANTSDADAHAPSLKKFYTEGEYVVCVVKQITVARDSVKEKHGAVKRSIQLSLAPEDVNARVKPEELVNGLLLQGSVESKEDRGWIINYGFAKGFCDAKKTDDELMVGKTFPFTLLLDSAKPAGNVLQVSAKYNRLSEVFLKSSTVLSRRSLLPGNVIDGVVRESFDDCYLIEIPSSVATLAAHSCDKRLEVGERVKVRLVWTDAESMALVSARRSVMELAANTRQQVDVGTKCQLALRSVDNQGGIVFSSEQGDCFASFAKLSDAMADSGGKDLKARKKKIEELKRCGNIVGRIIAYDIFDASFQVSLQESVLSAPFISYSGISPGDIVKGEIVKIADYGLLVQLADNIRAICPLFHLSDTHVPSSKILAKYSLGQRMSFRVLEVDCDARRVTVCRRKKLLDSANPVISSLSQARPGLPVDGYVISVKQNGAVIRFYESLTAFLPVAELCDDQFVESADSILRVGQSVSVRVKLADPVKQQLIVSMKKDPLKKLKPEKRVETEPGTIANPCDENVDRKEEQRHLQPRKKLKEIFEQLDSDQETSVAAMPEAEGENKPLKKTSSKSIVDEFEKRLLATPNASAVWIDYAATLLSLGNVDSGRAILERALFSISIREQSEKLNIWSALLNLENIYGTSASLKALFERALNHTEPKHLHLRLADIYSHSAKYAEAAELFAVMQKRFRQSCKIWLAAIVFHMAKSRDLATARRLLPEALKSLPTRKHIKITLKCAQLEYKWGEIERGRTLFEGMLSINPKRTDLWSVYIQMEENRLPKDSIDDLSRIRRIYERVLASRLSSKKAKMLFKAFLAFEKAHGDAAGVERVKQLARDYVERRQ